MSFFNKINPIKVLVLGLLVVFSTTFIACKHDDDDEDVVTATITLDQPKEGDTLALNDTLKIRGTINSTAELHGYSIVVTNTTKNTVLLNQEFHSHGTALTLNTNWINTLTEHSSVEVKVIAVIDHEGNTTTKTVRIHCHN